LSAQFPTKQKRLTLVLVCFVSIKDFIITQMFFDSAVFITFAEDCKKWGINCPVVPGLMCINAYPGFAKMTKFCKTRVPAKLAADMEAIKDDAPAVKQFGTDYIAMMCRELLASGHVDVLHFYTLNLEKVVYGVLDALGLSSGSALLEQANEKDESSQVAKGSAWARVGDRVQTEHGAGVVTVMDAETATCSVESDGKVHENLLKGSYTKIF
jgi:methylenetetrahydrofolate reductase (NADPH)